MLAQRWASIVLDGIASCLVCKKAVLMYADDEFVMISALQHYLFCPRQCALIHVENLWDENYLTASGRLLHERVDRVGQETRGDVRLVTSLRIASRVLGISGVADMVEMPLAPGRPPYPVEYKRGKPKSHRADEVQLCAQALCLEEMLGVAIPEGALFYGEPRRRTVVAFDDALRALTRDTAAAVHRLIRAGTIPAAEYGSQCKACSLFDLCQPQSPRRSARQWLERNLEEFA